MKHLRSKRVSARADWATVIATFSLCLAPLAATAAEVTLRFANGQDSISGELQAYEDGRFRIDSTIGMIVIPDDGVTCIGDACPEGTKLVLENARVVLASKDGSVTFEGDLIEATASDYVIATSIGEQRIPIDLVTCEGEGCVAISVADIGPLSGDVTLSNKAITLEGELLGFEDGSYILQEPTLGEVRVSADDFECAGAGCPNL